MHFSTPIDDMHWCSFYSTKPFVWVENAGTMQEHRLTGFSFRKTWQILWMQKHRHMQPQSCAQAWREKGSIVTLFPEHSADPSPRKSLRFSPKRGIMPNPVATLTEPMLLCSDLQTEWVTRRNPAGQAEYRCKLRKFRSLPLGWTWLEDLRKSLNIRTLFPQLWDGGVVRMKWVLSRCRLGPTHTHVILPTKRRQHKATCE